VGETRISSDSVPKAYILREMHRVFFSWTLGTRKNSTKKLRLYKYGGTVVLVGLVCLALWHFPLFRVYSHSMEDTLHDGDIVVVKRTGPIIRRGGESLWVPTRGQIILFRVPSDDSTIAIKRVIGVSGDQIRVVKGMVFVNGFHLPEPYVRQYKPSELPLDPWPVDNHSVDMGFSTVPKGHCFVLGDNRSNSVDSREWGFIPNENVVGIMVWAIHGRSISSNR
jgi:signal peptidase I